MISLKHNIHKHALNDCKVTVIDLKISVLINGLKLENFRTKLSDVIHKHEINLFSTCIVSPYGVSSPLLV